MPPLILITGATDGIGRETALALTRRNASVIVHGRNAQRIEAVHRELVALGKGEVPPPVQADLASLAAVRRMAEELHRRGDSIDVLLNNAALVTKSREESEDGFELMLAVNHLAPFLLTHLLLDLVRASTLQRIVNVSSMAQRNGVIDMADLALRGPFRPYAAYARTKLANVLFTVELARRLGPKPTVNALHPGVVSTKLITQGIGGSGWESLAEASRTSVWLALDREVEGVTGKYFDRSQSTVMNSVANDTKLCAEFYEASAKMVGVPPLPSDHP